MDARLLQFGIGFEQFAHGGQVVGHVIHAHRAAIIGLAAGNDYIQIGECKPVMLLIIGKESERRVAIGDLRAEDFFVPIQHLGKAPRAVDDMDWLGFGYGHCYFPLIRQKTE